MATPVCEPLVPVTVMVEVVDEGPDGDVDVAPPHEERRLNPTAESNRTITRFRLRGQPKRQSPSPNAVAGRNFRASRLRLGDAATVVIVN